MVETLRKLYLTAMVSFFTSGSMVQIVLSLVVSVLACIQQARYWPFKHQWVNWLQQSSLMVIWATLQSGMLLQVYVLHLIFAILCLCYSLFVVRSCMHLQYRGSLSETSKTAVGVLLFAANVIMIMGPLVIVGLVAVRALPDKFVEQFIGGDEPRLTTSAATTTNCDLSEEVRGLVIELGTWRMKHLQGIQYETKRVLGEWWYNVFGTHIFPSSHNQ